ncbi:hypothetical protein [uncultured Alistipes sp.]|uniref:hypothetical protein n=1 Tax=uncultured Alistipes sp. TaxID=538949 RepID=UPI00261E36D2|nr:hypothetical protein [uncultured Alistipes sp.]
MKKVYTFIVVVAAAAMVSCAGNANKPAAAEEAAEAAAEFVPAECVDCPDSLKCDSCAAAPCTEPAPAEAAE